MYPHTPVFFTTARTVNVIAKGLSMAATGCFTGGKAIITAAKACCTVAKAIIAAAKGLCITARAIINGDIVISITANACCMCAIALCNDDGGSCEGVAECLIYAFGFLSP